MNKKLYYASFFIAPVLCFLLALITKFDLEGNSIDCAEIMIFVISIICGPVVSLTCGIGVALSDIIMQNYSLAICSGLVASMVGFLCGFLYKKAFFSMQSNHKKILSILCGVALSLAIWFAISFLLCKNTNDALVLFMFRALISLISGLLACFILPKQVKTLY